MKPRWPGGIWLPLATAFGIGAALLRFWLARRLPKLLAGDCQDDEQAEAGGCDNGQIEAEVARPLPESQESQEPPAPAMQDTPLPHPEEADAQETDGSLEAASTLTRGSGGPPETREGLTGEQQLALADLVVERLQHLGDPEWDRDADVIVRNSSQTWDLTKMVAQHVEDLAAKVRAKDIDRLLLGDSVQLDKVKLDSFEVQVVTRVVRLKNPDMKFLTLNSNPSLGPDGGRHLAELLVWPEQQLVSLLLGGCGLGDDGIASIAGALRANSRLEILDLRQNLATDRAAETLAAALEENDSLESLYLNNDAWSKEEQRNTIADFGAWKLAFAMAERRQALKVSLHGNAVSEDVQNQIKETLGRRMRF